ncbi:MAG: hypothetical protein HC896_07145 [Bacteroidales bacterium]|nr:hypothetical protein [Bacteroidales bacterium]
MAKYKSISISTRSSMWTSKELSDELIVDVEDLAKEIESQCLVLDKEGYDVLSITPINSGNINGGTGYFYTASIVVTGIKR